MKALKILATLMAVALALACGRQDQNQQTSSEEQQVKIAQQLTDSSPERKGRAVYEESGCATCHAIGGVGGGIGPKLDKVGEKYDAEKLKEILRNPKVLNPRTLMPPFDGSDEELEFLVAYLKSLK